MTGKRIAVILNPGSGKEGDGPGGDDLRGLFAARGAEVDVLALRKGVAIGELAARALSQGADIVVAAGGDGTICAVAEALAGRGVPMGVLPRGTFNYFARSLDLPLDEAAAIDVILNGRAEPVRTGRINGRLFLNNTSVGRYPEILAEREGVYKRWGRSRIAAYWSVLKTLMTLRRPLKLRIDADGTLHEVRTPLIFVLNNAYQMNRLGLEGGAEMAEGKLVMYISPDAGRLGMIRHALAMAMAVPQRGHDFQMVAARRFEVMSRRTTHRIALDGERLRLDSPLSIVAEQRELSVIVPAGYDRAVR